MKSKSKNKLIVIILGSILALISVINLNNNISIINNHQIPKNKEEFDLKSSSGDWEEEHPITIGLSVSGISVGDVNNDYLNEIVITRPDEDLITIFLYYDYLAEWHPEFDIAVGNNPRNVFIGDANNDGFNDIAIANVDDNSVSILCWNETIDDWNPQFTKPVGSKPYGVFIEDANNDGKNDIITVNYDSNDTSILSWNITSSDWDSQINKVVGGNPMNLFVGDANNDGFNDIATANYADNNTSILCWNNTISDWDPQITQTVESGPISIFIGDANNDGKNDIITACYLANRISLLLWNVSTITWNPRIFFTMGTWYWGASSVFIGDVNSDGFNDLVASKAEGYVTIKCWDPITNYWGINIYRRVLGTPMTVFVGDVNNDGMNDIVTDGIGGALGSISIILSKSPVPPILYDILPNPDYDGIINLNWSDEITAYFYYVYRSTSKFTDVSGLKPIAKVSDSNYTDSISVNNIYYYAIVSGNIVLNSSRSNRDCVTVEIPSGLNPLYFEIKEQSFNTGHFDIIFSILDKEGLGLEGANIQMWWDGNQVPINNITDLENGLYKVLLNPITTLPGEDPILLNMTLSVDGYDTKYIEIYLAVDPESINKEIQKDKEQLIPGYNLLFALSLIALISMIFLIKKKLKNN